MHHILFILLFVDGQCDCFHSLAIINNIAVNIHVRFFVDMFSVFLHVYNT